MLLADRRLRALMMHEDPFLAWRTSVLTSPVGS
jgi:hypothetical protein